MEKIRKQIEAIVREVCPDIEISDDTLLVDEGIIESFDAIRIISEFMEAFNISIDADDFEPENLNTIDSMCELVASKLKALNRM
ncbi:MAG: acyl carrier protein [Lachnospiraceae bacterium]|nr:acyl carrier protein [Lachnospiraceae bacterium]